MQNKKKRNKFIHLRKQEPDQSQHIIEQKLNRKEDLIDKYQTEIQQLLQHVQYSSKKVRTIAPTLVLNRKQRVMSSMNNHSSKNTIQMNEDPINDYKKIILGLEYALENQKKTFNETERKNKSLESQISNLRNLLVRPEHNNNLNKFDEYESKIAQLQASLEQQHTQLTTILDSKIQTINFLELENKTLKPKIEQNPSTTLKKIYELTNLVEELRNTIDIKNIKIERLKNGDGTVSEQTEQRQEKLTQLEYYKKRIRTLSEQLELANKLIIRKNTEIIEISKSKRINEEVVIVMDNLLQKSEIQFPNIVSHPVVNKLRILLREKLVFEKELYEKLTIHNKKIQMLEEDQMHKQGKFKEENSDLIRECKELTQLVNTLEKKLLIAEKVVEEKKNEVDILKNDFNVEKKNFIYQIKQLSNQLNGIIASTQNEFEKQRIENLKLVEQNRSLLLLVSGKEKELQDKSTAIKSFEKYKQTINNIDLGSPASKRPNLYSEESNKLESNKPDKVIFEMKDNEDTKPTKLLLLKSFSSWMLEWNRMRNWNNRKALLNVLIDKKELREDAVENINNLISVIHECYFNSKNHQIQQRATVLLSKFIKFNILKNKNLYLARVTPYVVRSFRSKQEGQDEEQLRVYNESALEITSELELNDQEWTFEMTNQMTAVNGLKFVFDVLNQSKSDLLTERAYNTLALICKKKQMIQFMISYDIVQMLLRNLDINYKFLPFLLYLLEIILDSDQFVAAASKNLLEFRALFNLLETNDTEILSITLHCLLKLCHQSAFLRAVNKKDVMSKLVRIFQEIDEFEIQKKCGKLFMILLEQYEVSDHQKLSKKQIASLIDILDKNSVISVKFARAIKTLLKCLLKIKLSDLDERVFNKMIKFIDQNFDRIDAKIRAKMIEMVNLTIERDKKLLEKNVNDFLINNIVKCYLNIKSTNTSQTIFLLNILKSVQDFKKTIQVLKIGRQSLINKLFDDMTAIDYNVSTLALKNLLSICKDKYSEKFITPANTLRMLKYCTAGKSEDEHVLLGLSVLYNLSKSEENSKTLIQNNLMNSLFSILVERQDKESVVFKVLALMDINHTNNYKKNILNAFITEKKLATLKTLNSVLVKSKNKTELGTRALFVYDFLNNKQQMESLASAVESNEWLVEDLVNVRNEYVDSLQPLVYKIELLLHEMSQESKKVKKLYEQFIVEDDVALSEN